MICKWLLIYARWVAGQSEVERMGVESFAATEHDRERVSVVVRVHIVDKGDWWMSWMFLIVQLRSDRVR